MTHLIQFPAETVKRILSGHQTRWSWPLTKPDWANAWYYDEDQQQWVWAFIDNGEFEPAECWREEPIDFPYQPGDVVVVQEEWFGGERIQDICYRVACPCSSSQAEHDAHEPWNPAESMPEKFSRLRLKITDSGVMRLGEMTLDQIKQHGVEIEWPPATAPMRPDYLEVWNIGKFVACYWNTRYPEHPWDENLWVGWIEFEMLEWQLISKCDDVVDANESPESDYPHKLSVEVEKDC